MKEVMEIILIIGVFGIYMVTFSKQMMLHKKTNIKDVGKDMKTIVNEFHNYIRQFKNMVVSALVLNSNQV